MVRINSEDYYKIWDEIDFRYQFFIPESLTRMSDSKIDELLRKVIDFHYDYADISRECCVAEIYARDSESIKGSLVENYLISLEEDFIFNTLRFFPKTSIELDEYLTFPSKLSFFDEESQIDSSYIYNLESGIDQSMHFFELSDKALLRSELCKVIDVDTHSYLAYEFGEYLENPLGFDLRVKSNIFCPFPSFIGNAVIGNSLNIPDNATRFNKFLSQLKKIWTEKYGWEFRSDGSSSAASALCLEEGGVITKRLN